MKRFALVASASLALMVGACDDDPSPRRDAAPEAGRDTGSETGGEGGTPGMCVGTFDRLNRTSLGALTSASGMCKAAGDLDLICSSELGGKIRREYAVACLPTLPGGNQAVIDCINELINREFPTLSVGCRGCYSATVACTLSNCVGSCGVDPNSSACVTCQTANGCLSQFFTCSGLPGGTPAPDAGPDTSPDTGGTPDGGVDSPVDAPADTAADTATDGSEG